MPDRNDFPPVMPSTDSVRNVDHSESNSDRRPYVLLFNPTKIGDGDHDATPGMGEKQKPFQSNVRQTSVCRRSGKIELKQQTLKFAGQKNRST